MSGQTMPLVFRVTFTHTNPIHVVVRAAFASKAGVHTLCGLPAAELPSMAAFEVGAERPVANGKAIPRNPFFSPKGCGACAERLAF